METLIGPPSIIRSSRLLPVDNGLLCLAVPQDSGTGSFVKDEDFSSQKL